MKMFRVGTNGKLKRFSAIDETRGGGIFQAEWRICYKISDDGTSVDVVIRDFDEKHRGAGEHILMGQYFDVRDFNRDKGRAVQRQQLEADEDLDKGFGQDPPPSGVGELSQTEKTKRLQFEQENAIPDRVEEEVTE